MAGTGVVLTENSIRFGDCVLNPSAFELRRGRRTVKLERIPLGVLLLLIEKHGSVVTRDAIAEHVWGKDVFVDVDNGINTAIRKIRQVLNDDPQKPRFVETIPGMGYRFIAALEESETDQSAFVTGPGPDDPPNVDVRIAGIAGQDRTPPQKGESFSVRYAWIRSAGLILGVVSVAGIVVALGWRHFNPERHVIRSIAVLPLQNLSADPSQEYFSDGMTEELITELSRIQALKVISHTSVMEYKGTKKHLPQIARELGVDGILEGSVIRENDEVRVTVQLLDGPEDRHLWSEEYERPLNGILNLQRDVAREITQEIRLKLTPEQQTRYATTQTINPHAYEQYLRGRYLLSTQYTMTAPLLQARTFFENAIQEDSKFAEAYSGLADAYLYLALYRFEAPEAALRSAHEALHRAAELDDTVGEIHDTLGMIHWVHDWDWAGAEREFDRSISLAPSYSCAHEDRAEYMALLGRREEALAELSKVSSLDLGPSAHMTADAVFYQLRDYPKLIETAKEGIALDPNEWVEHRNLGIGYEGTGKLLEAIAEYKRAVILSNGDQDAVAFLAHANAVSGNKPAAMKILHDWENVKGSDVHPSYLLATLHAGLGQKDMAFEYLSRASRERSLELAWHLKSDPRIDSLRTDPRFLSLVRQMGIPQKSDQLSGIERR
jgi:TolB-like protein/DNA-binding winged helix-turn-helix (wHTH) protein